MTARAWMFAVTCTECEALIIEYTAFDDSAHPVVHIRPVICCPQHPDADVRIVHDRPADFEPRDEL